jgi:Cu-processing system permease protein
MKVPYLAWLTLHEVRRRRLLLVAGILGFAFLTLYGIGFYMLHRDNLVNMEGRPLMIREMNGTATIMGLYAVNFLVVMLSVLASVDSLSGEIANHAVQTLVTKPVRRWEIILGKWLGFAVVVTGMVLVLGGGVAVIAWAISGQWTANLAVGLLLMMLEGWLLTAVTMLGGTRLSTIANGVVAFMLFGLAFVGGWMEQIGAFVHNESAVDIGIVSSLILPTESLWRRAAFLMNTSELANLGMSPFSSGSVPSPAMVIYACLYVVAALGLALYSFQRRDL